MGLPLVDILLPTHDGCLQGINQNGTEKKLRKGNLQDCIKKQIQGIC